MQVLTIDDLSLEEIEAVLDRASRLAEGVDPGRRPFSTGLLFLSSSLRTRVGFSEATIRLGGTPIHVSELRFGSAMSASESVADALRTLSGMVDVVVARSPMALDAQLVGGNCVSPFVNGGDASDHPSQVLIDLAAAERYAGRLEDLNVALVGDLGMRAAQSLLRFFKRRAPARLTLIGPPTRTGSSPTKDPAVIKGVERRNALDLSGIDVVYMIGLPMTRGDDTLTADQRSAFKLTPERLSTAPVGAVVLSPLPVVDEIDPSLRFDRRVRIFDQSDHGVWVRMALLELVLGRRHVGL